MFILKTIRDRAILFKYWTARVLWTTALGPLNFFAEMKNVVYFKSCKKFSNPQGAKAYSSGTSQNFLIFQFSAVILNFDGNGKCRLSRTIRDRVISGKFGTRRVLRTTPLRPLKIFGFSKFQLPSSIYAEMENVVYFVNHKR